MTSKDQSIEEDKEEKNKLVILKILCMPITSKFFIFKKFLLLSCPTWKSLYQVFTLAYSVELIYFSEV